MGDAPVFDHRPTFSSSLYALLFPIDRKFLSLAPVINESCWPALMSRPTLPCPCVKLTRSCGFWPSLFIVAQPAFGTADSDFLHFAGVVACTQTHHHHLWSSTVPPENLPTSPCSLLVSTASATRRRSMLTTAPWHSIQGGAAPCPEAGLWPCTCNCSRVLCMQ